MIRCAEITHEKKNPNHQQSDWTGNVKQSRSTDRVVQSTLPMTFCSPSLLSMFASLLLLRAESTLRLGSIMYGRSEEKSSCQRKVKADTILIRASFLLARAASVLLVSKPHTRKRSKTIKLLIKRR